MMAQGGVEASMGRPEDDDEDGRLGLYMNGKWQGFRFWVFSLGPLIHPSPESSISQHK